MKKLGAYIFHTLLIWGSYLLMFALPFWALEQTANVPISGMLLGFIFELQSESLLRMEGWELTHLLVVAAFYLQ